MTETNDGKANTGEYAVKEIRRLRGTLVSVDNYEGEAMYGYSEATTRDGRTVLISKPRRTPHVNRAWGYYNAVTVVWTDGDGHELSRESVSLGKFNKEHKPVATGNRRVFDHGSQTNDMEVTTMATISKITRAYIRTYSDSGQTTAYVEWVDSRGETGRTEGNPDNPHMKALLARAEREGLAIERERW